MSVGYVNSIGRNLPVLMDVNLIPTGATLADGRPIYSTAVSAATRVDPTFNHVNVFQSIGESTYNAFTATLTKRMTHGWQAQAHLHAGARRRQRAADRHLRRRQRRRSRVGSVEPRSRHGRDAVQPDAHVLAVDGHRAAGVGGRLGAALLNNNQVGIILQANSGLPFNIRSNLDLNVDGVTTTIGRSASNATPAASAAC